MNSLFDEYFKNIYLERWDELKEALLKEDIQIAFNCSQKKSLNSILENPQMHIASENSFSQRSSDGNLLYYIMDPASLAPVLSLDIREDHSVCDLCSAPGGKSLAILSCLAQTGGLLSIDNSRDRFFRLKKVIQQYVPSEQKEIVRAELKDGQKLGFYYQNEFDRILVDAPCSSERHLLHQPKYMKNWTPKKAKMLSQKQYTLLCAAMIAVRSGGKIVYSTCSINPEENDRVVERFIKKKSQSIDLDSFEFPYLKAEKTQYGYMIYPHISGYGPIYFSRFIKK